MESFFKGDGLKNEIQFIMVSNNIFANLKLVSTVALEIKKQFYENVAGFESLRKNFLILISIRDNTYI